MLPGFDNTKHQVCPDWARSVPRNGGSVYDYFWQKAKGSGMANPDFISITSFNVWVEGSQIEPAKPKSGYLDYGGSETFYLQRTNDHSSNWTGY